MIQEIAPLRLDNQFKSEAPALGDYVLTFVKNAVFVLLSGEVFDFPVYEKLDQVNDENNIYLFSIDSKRFFLNNGICYASGGAVQAVSVQQFRFLQPGALAFAGITAYQLSKWYQSRRFCGCCGKPMHAHKRERALICEDCGIVEYPKISPAIIVGVTDGDKLLMTKYASGEYKDYALVAGFAEIGETLEETVAREVIEEVGLRVKNITYFGSQPWAFSDSLLVGFFAQLDGSAEVSLQTDELSESLWISRGDIPPNKTSLGVTQKMIEAFKNSKI